MLWSRHLTAALVVTMSVAWPGKGEQKCLPVQSEVLTAGDLASANSAFASLDPRLAIGLAPMPGARRVFNAMEFARLSRQFHLTLASTHEACFEWPMQVVPPAALVTAMARVLSLDSGAIKIVEQSQFPAPPGELVFPREALTPVAGSNGALWLWRGSVQYGASRSFPIWAKLLIEAPSRRVLARSDLAPGEPIQESQLESVTSTDGFAGGVFATTPEEVLGRVATTRIRAGAPIRLTDLKTPPDIAAGALVQIEVRNGPMRIYAVGRAERSGHLGETIPLVNPVSSAHFSARVEGKDRASVTVPAK